MIQAIFVLIQPLLGEIKINIKYRVTLTQVNLFVQLIAVLITGYAKNKVYIVG